MMRLLPSFVGSPSVIQIKGEQCYGTNTPGRVEQQRRGQGTARSQYARQEDKGVKVTLVGRGMHELTDIKEINRSDTLSSG
jgi:hypothetical protein